MKFIAIDLDGTLLNSNHSINPKDLEIINKAKDAGITVVISTGRTFEDAKFILQSHNLIVPYIISCNGAIINNFDGELLHQFPADKAALEPVLSFLYYNNYYFSITTNNARIFPKNSKNRLMADFYVAKGKNPNLKESDLNGLIDLFYNQDMDCSNVLDSLDDFLAFDKDIFGVCAVSFDDEKLTLGLNAFKDIENLCIFKSAFNNFELINHNCSKGQAIKTLCADLNIDLSETMAIGDNQNDLSMFEIVHYSVAMGNALDSIKAKTTIVTLDNNSCGVGHAIKEFYLY